MIDLTIIQDEFNNIAIDLVRKHKELGMKASGAWIQSLETKITQSKASILAEDYTQYLVSGRPPSDKFPPIDEIKKWIKAKSIQSDIPINSLAFLIARKIRNQGTKYFIQGGTDLIDAVITDARIQDLVTRVGEQMTIEILHKIENTLKAA